MNHFVTDAKQVQASTPSGSAVFCTDCLDANGGVPVAAVLQRFAPGDKSENNEILACANCGRDVTAPTCEKCSDGRHEIGEPCIVGESFDECPTCDRRILDGDMSGCESPSGQRYCVGHIPASVGSVSIEWVEG